MTEDRSADGVAADALAAAVASWSAELRAIDLVGDLELDLTGADPVALAGLLAGRTVRLRALVRDPTAHAVAVRRLRYIRDRVRDLEEERGLSTGRLRIEAADAPPRDRVLRISTRSASEDDFDLTSPADGPAPPPVAPVRVTAGWSVDAGARAAADLAAVAGLLPASDVVVALATGGSGPVEPLGVAAGSPDRVDPGQEHLIVDTDREQTVAVDAVLAGRHVVVEGGPGTGRVTTVVAMVGALIGAGRSVLVVAEKRAVQASVRDRLAAAGLGHLVIDGADDVRARITGTLAAVAADPPPSSAPEAPPGLGAARDRLREQAAALHERRPPWDVSAYEVQAGLVGLPPRAESRVRLRGEALAGLYGEALDEVRAVVREWAALGGASLTAVDSPWYGARVGTPAEAVAARAAAADLADRVYPEVRAAVERALGEAGLAPAPSVADWSEALELLAAVGATERVLTPAVWIAPLPDLVAATADRDWRREHDERSLTLRARAAARREAAALWRPGRPEREELHEALVRAEVQLGAWSRRALRDATPRTVEVRDVQERYAELRAALARLQDLLPDRDFPALTPAVLEKTLRGLAADPPLSRP